MLRYSLPQYRLPKDMLSKELEIIAGLGVTFRFGQKLGAGPFDAADVHRALEAATAAVGKMGKAKAGDRRPVRCRPAHRWRSRFRRRAA